MLNQVLISVFLGKIKYKIKFLIFIDREDLCGLEDLEELQDVNFKYYLFVWDGRN